jgi:hypothetical protein
MAVATQGAARNMNNDPTPNETLRHQDAQSQRSASVVMLHTLLATPVLSKKDAGAEAAADRLVEGSGRAGSRT